jgi:uncharacterized protein YyaL (SSP411 family)
MVNRLAQASSPYLLQHKDNPVHWQVWGDAALAQAKTEDKPILLSIGYAACHWCHVMAHESFEDEAVAALMNRDFVNIKVDREERPDIDHLYMTALHAMGEQGGWPLTMCLTPDGSPFWGGTYFPPTPRFGRPSFTQVLTAIAQAWAQDRARITESTTAMTRALAANAAARPGEAPGPLVLDTVRYRLLAGIDWQRGGFQGAPKFPNTPSFRFLWQESFRAGAAPAAAAVTLLLTKICQGGIYDHLGGGFARYATDADWLVPHFEKMLYDNALILELLAFAGAVTGNPLFAARARETIGWLTRDMAAEGAFAASEDADSEGVEGKFYVWTSAEVKEVLGADTEFFAAHYDLPARGNWEEHIILERKTALGAADARLAVLRGKLLARRSQRIRPGRDDKVLCDWNALLVSALVKASFVFEEPGWLALAVQTFANLETAFRLPEGRLAHAMRAGKISADGLLEDQAAMLNAALSLFEATGETAYLIKAEELAIIARAQFGDGAGAYYMTASDAPDVPGPRSRAVTDGPTPSGIGQMAMGLARLYHLTGAADYRAQAEAVLAAYGGRPEMLSASPTLLAAADFLENAACIVLTGGDISVLLQAAMAAPDPAIVVLRGGVNLPAAHPAHGKMSDSPAAFVCRHQTCLMPVSTPDALRGVLRPVAQS